MIEVDQEDLEDSIPAEDNAGNVDLVVVVGVGTPVRDILQVVVAVGVLLFGVGACHSQDEEVGIGGDHRVGIVEDGTVDDFASQVVAVEEEVVAAGEEVVAIVS